MSDDSSIEDLKTQDYSARTREQKRYQGQISAVRYLDPHDYVDATKLKATINSPAVQTWMADLNLTDEDYIAWMQEQGEAKNRRHHLFAVSASQRANTENVGEVQGFVYFYSGPEEKQQAQRLVEEGLLTSTDLDQNRLLEISFAKSPDTPPGRMVGGIMQACLEISNRMQRVGDSDPNNIVVLAYIDPENSNSIKAAEAAGFIGIGTVSGYGEDTEPNKVYKLSWSLLNQKMQSDALKYFNIQPA
ncbi:hypothetical protein A2397_03870 [Candidatus Amesbacteria bacterium RIFOXYB1_FULL_44_23]|uniref:N-acetyltransferase domain-containing protein n=1 Tax=Candidatus Amesbacteria bacterium RIFOXYB1_FULL_44_23 TaxID=1797263 RepID=A0A1F4ZY88_9BACT|nr:MAG: hypothetical protein A2397_03870 [Candidatus Amesbacteria bacterium RIFOXYB1_FULL_44_23]